MKNRIANERKLKKMKNFPNCVYCKIKLTSDNASLDHIIPRMRFRLIQNKEDIHFRRITSHNSVMCCRKCNGTKGFLTPLEFFMGCRYSGLKILPFRK